MTADVETYDWLLASDEPAVRYRTLTELAGRSESDPAVVVARTAIPRGPKVQALLAGLQPDGGFGVDQYRKWNGGHWRLVALADLRYPRGDEGLRPAVDAELDWAIGLAPRWIDGKARQHASMEGNAIGAACRLGFADDERIEVLVDRLRLCQWPDGGWNCDPRREASHSSFHESLAPLWGLSEYRRATGDSRVDGMIQRAADMFLRARLFRSERRGKALWPPFLKLRYPPYWHYDVLAGLRVLADLDLASDPRASEALDVVESKRGPDGRWAVNGAWWKSVGGHSYPEAVNWGRSGPNELLTFHALRVLQASGRTP